MSSFEYADFSLKVGEGDSLDRVRVVSCDVHGRGMLAMENGFSFSTVLVELG